MAGKDFAHINKPSQKSNEPQKNVGSKLPLAPLAPLAATLCVIASFAIGFSLGQQQSSSINPVQKSSDKLTDAQHQKTIIALKDKDKALKKLQQVLEKCRQQKKEGTQVGDLTFYNKLPQQAVNPEPLHVSTTHKKPVVAKADRIEKNKPQHHINKEETTHKKPKPKVAKNNGSSFYLQVASFKLHKDAVALISKLQNMGIDARSQRVSLNKFGTRYRVKTTPFTQKSSAVAAQKIIQEKLKVNGLILRHE